MLLPTELLGFHRNQKSKHLLCQLEVTSSDIMNNLLGLRYSVRQHRGG